MLINLFRRRHPEPELHEALDAPPPPVMRDEEYENARAWFEGEGR